MTAEIMVKIHPDGTMEIEPTGHQGASCLEELNKILEGMRKDGIEVRIDQQKFKEEYYVAANANKAKASTKH